MSPQSHPIGCITVPTTYCIINYWLPRSLIKIIFIFLVTLDLVLRIGFLIIFIKILSSAMIIHAEQLH